MKKLRLVLALLTALALITSACNLSLASPNPVPVGPIPPGPQPGSQGPQPGPGQVEPGQPPPGQPQPGQPRPGQPQPGQPQPGLPQSGQPQPPTAGLPQPGQPPQSGQPQPTQVPPVSNPTPAATQGPLLLQLSKILKISTATPKPLQAQVAKKVLPIAQFDLQLNSMDINSAGYLYLGMVNKTGGAAELDVGVSCNGSWKVIEGLISREWPLNHYEDALKVKFLSSPGATSSYTTRYLVHGEFNDSSDYVGVVCTISYAGDPDTSNNQLYKL